jgi:Ankyrin repeats (3 copies)/Ankyrin repeats (many copies)
LQRPPLGGPSRTRLRLRMSSIPRTEAGLRALDESLQTGLNDARGTIVALAQQLTMEQRVAFVHDVIIMDLGELVRSGLATGLPACTRLWERAARPLLNLAARHGATHAMQSLLAGGARVSLADAKGVTALHTAAWQGHLDCVHILLAARADPNAVNQVVGNTPLMDAVVHHHVDCVRALIPVSNLDLVNRGGRTALHLSIMSAAHECFDALLPHLRDVDSMRTLPGLTPNGEPEPFFSKTPLHLACTRDVPEIVTALLQRGASRLARDNKQFTPLHCAATSHLAA